MILLYVNSLQGVDTYKSVKVVTDRGMTTAAEKK